MIVTLLLTLLPRRIIHLMASYYPYGPTREKCWRKLGVKIGKDVQFNIGIKLSGYHIKNKELLEIGDRVALGTDINFIVSTMPNNSNLKDNKYVKENLIKEAKILVKNDAWIGVGAVILPGITIGESSIIGAGSVVTEDVKPFTIVAGVPAKKIRDL